MALLGRAASYQEQLRIASTSTSIPTDVALAEAPSGAAVVEWGRNAVTFTGRLK
jgi:hypothetical protein